MNKLENGKLIPQTQEEINADIVRNNIEKINLDAKVKKAKKLSNIYDRWPTDLDLIEDILNRGVQAVKTDYNKIK